MASQCEVDSSRDSAHLLPGQLDQQHQCDVTECVYPCSQALPYYGSIDSDPTQQGLTHVPVTGTEAPSQFASKDDAVGVDLPTFQCSNQEVHGVDLREEVMPPPAKFDQFCDKCSCHVKFFAVASEDRGPLSRLLLKKARRAGWWMLWTFILPLIFPIKVFLAWVYVQFILSLSIVAVSVLAYIVSNKSDHDMHIVAIVHLTAVCFWVLFSAGDGLLPVCSTGARSWLTRTDGYQWRRTVIAMIRLAYTATCLYVAVVCDVIYLAVARPKIDDYTVKILKARVFLTFIYYFGLVPATVLVIIAKAIKTMSKLRKDDTANTMRYSGIRFLVRFWIHFLGQAITQALMLVSIGALLPFQTSDGHLTLNVNLWIMIATGLTVPIVGTLIFFSTHVYWVQEFLIGICTTVLSIASGPDSQFGNPLEWLELSDGQRECLHQLKEGTNLRMLKKEATYIRSRDTRYKVILPFEAPVPIFLCIIYTLLLSAFVVFALIQGTASSWNTFLYITVGIYTIVNIYAIIIGFLWVALSAAVVLLLLLYLALRQAGRYSGRNATNEVCACCHNFSTVG